jgi:flagellar assembly protein FliH
MARSNRIVQAPDARPIAPRAAAPVLPAWTTAANDVVRDAFGAPVRSTPSAEDRVRTQAAQLEADRRALDAERAQLQLQQARYFERIAQLAAATQAQARPQPEAIVDLALLVARELVGREVELDRQHFVDALAAELLPLCDGERIDLRLPPAEAAQLTSLHPELATRVRLVADATLEPGDCIVETATSIIDRSLTPRLAAVRTALVQALWGTREKEAA